ncbi:MAG: hypothetical protein ACKOPC_09820 [Methylocystis sp.]
MATASRHQGVLPRCRKLIRSGVAPEVFFRRRQSSKEETGAMDFRETPLWRILSGRSY